MSVSTVTGQAGIGHVNGSLTTAKFSLELAGIAISATGVLYLCEGAGNASNHWIRKISGEFVLALAGSGTEGFVNGPGSTAQFDDSSLGITVNSSGVVYVAEQAGRIRRITTAGFCSTFVDSSSPAMVSLLTGTVSSPTGICTDSNDNMYVTLGGNDARIIKITAAGVATRLAGSATSGFVDGVGSSARFGQSPQGIAVNAAGTIVYVADFRNHAIRTINVASGAVTTLAGDGTAGYLDGPGNTAKFNFPIDVAVDSAGFVYVLDFSNNRIRRIDPSGVVSSWAGDGTVGFADGPNQIAKFSSPNAICCNSDGSILWVADTGNARIRMIVPDSVGGWSLGLVTKL